MNFKSYYTNLNTFEQLQLYLIPILIIVFIYLNLDIKSTPEGYNIDNNILKEINRYKLKIKNEKDNKNQKIKQINILKIFELLSHNLNITIQSYKFDKNTLQLKFKAKFKNSMSFLNAIEKMASINSLELFYKSSILDVDLSMDIKISKNIDMSNISFDKNIANPFILKKNTNKNKVISRAIIGQYLILNNKWYKVGDKYKRYIIKKISVNHIELEYKNKITKMEIFDAKNY